MAVKCALIINKSCFEEYINKMEVLLQEAYYDRKVK